MLVNEFMYLFVYECLYAGIGNAESIDHLCSKNCPFPQCYEFLLCYSSAFFHLRINIFHSIESTSLP